MSSYLTRKGTANNKIYLISYAALLDLSYEYQPDDGKAIPCGTPEWPENVQCPDCGEKVVWAEACFTPGHRICKHCGSHWELHSPVEPEGQWFLRRARFYQ